MQKTDWRRIVLVILAFVLFGSMGMRYLKLTQEVYGEPRKVPTPNYPIDPADQYLLDKLDELPLAQSPLYNAFMLHPDPEYVSSSLEERKKLTEMMQSTKQIYYLSGEETAGSMIKVPGADLQLPKDVYVRSFITNIYCAQDDETYCPQLPVYVLAKLDDDTHVRIEGDGSVYTWSRKSAEEVEKDKESFQFVLDALHTELKLDYTVEKVESVK